jgi:diguanylate cyclase
MAWASGSFLAAACAATLSYAFLSTSAQSLLDDAVAVAAAGAMFTGILLSRPEPRYAWVLLALSALLFAGGDIVYGTSQPVPSAADMLYISAYPLLALGLVGLARSTAPREHDHMAIDAVIITAGVGLVAMVFLMVPAAHPSGVGFAARAVSLGYPLMDLALLGVLIRPLRSPDAPLVPFALIGAALLLRLVGDTGYAMLDFGTAYSVGSSADVAWLLSYACFGAALLHPAVAEGVFAPARWTAVPPVGAPEPQTRPSAVAVAKTQAVRFRVVLSWASLMLLCLAGFALFVGMSWRASDVALLGGAYATTGSFTLIASFISA